MNALSTTKVAIVVALAAFLGAGEVLAAEQDLRAVDAGVFKSTDLNNDGKISRKEIIHYTDLVFISMDTNDDDTLTSEEFLQWSPGYADLAENSGKTQDLNKAKQTAFSRRI